MYSETDFYNLSETKQRRLVHNRQAATSEGLLDEVPEGRPPVRIFEKSLDELILDRLEGGRYTIRELAEEFGVAVSEVRKIINKYRRHGRDTFTGEFFKLNLLCERNGVVRVKSLDGASFHYSLEKIPYSARLLDPTLTISLLDTSDRLSELPILAEAIPPGAAAEIDETYAILLGEFWGIDPQTVFDDITEYERTYVETLVAPLPIVVTTQEFDQVRDRFSQSENVYKRFRNPEGAAKNVVDDFMETVRGGNPGIRMYQVVSIELADLKRATGRGTAARRRVNRQIDNVISTLNPEVTHKSENHANEGSTHPNVTLEDAIQTVLTDAWQTPTEVYDQLPADMQPEISISEVEQKLKRLAKLGVISRRSIDGRTEYNSMSETVN